MCAERDQIERQQRAAQALTLSLGASALSLATAGSIWLVARRQETGSLRVSLSASRSGLVCALHGWF